MFAREPEACSCIKHEIDFSVSGFFKYKNGEISR